MTVQSSVAGVILAGGKARRMGGVDKGNVQLAGHTLLQHVIARLEGQVGQLILSVEGETRSYAGYGLDQVADPSPGHRGPLGGLLSALRYISGRFEWLVLVPCDAPFLPDNLVQRLHWKASDCGKPGCVVRYQGEVQPTFSIWNQSLLPSLDDAVSQQGMAGFKQFLKVESLGVLEWETADISPFYNINDAHSLSAARTILEEKDAH